MFLYKCDKVVCVVRVSTLLVHHCHFVMLKYFHKHCFLPAKSQLYNNTDFLMSFVHPLGRSLENSRAWYGAFMLYGEGRPQGFQMPCCPFYWTLWEVCALTSACRSRHKQRYQSRTRNSASVCRICSWRKTWSSNCVIAAMAEWEQMVKTQSCAVLCHANVPDRQHMQNDSGRRYAVPRSISKGACKFNLK